MIPMAGIGLATLIVPLSLLANYVGRQRQYRHLERMQAMKLGVVPPATVPLPGPGSIVAIGAGVPSACMLAALLATLSFRSHSPDILPVVAMIWGAASFLGLGALATGLVLGLLLHRANARAAASAQEDSAKPAYDPDMFDAAHRAY